MTNQTISLCAAKNSDMNRLPRLLSLFPEHVLVRDAFGGFYQLTTLVHGPFYVRREGDYWVLIGTRLADEKNACLRIIEWGEDRTPVLQWKEALGDDWRLDQAWSPMHQLYIPQVVLVPRAKTA